MGRWESKDLLLPFRGPDPPKEMGAPCPSHLGTWDSTNPNQQVLYQGMSLLMPQASQEKSRGFSPRALRFGPLEPWAKAATAARGRRRGAFSVP